jgi:uncharacterized damage-inducible protein DinB
MTPENARFFLHQIALPSLQREHATTTRVIEAIPLDKGDYRPADVSRTALELAWHIVATENRFLNAVAAGAFDLSPQTRPESLKNAQDIARWYAGIFEKGIQTVQNLPEESLLKIVDFRGILQQPAIAYLQTMMVHTIHHRGQLSTYLRPMGAKVPVIYGESYDSAEARKAAQPRT